MLRLRGGAGVEDDSSGDEDEGRDEAPQKKSGMDESSFLDADLSDELFQSPTLPAKQGVQPKRRSNSCDGRLEGCVYFHSTPLRPGHGLLNVTFKGDMNQITTKIIDIKRKKKRQQSMVVQQGKTEDVTSSACILIGQRTDGEEVEKCQEDVDKKIIAGGGRGTSKDGNGDDKVKDDDEEAVVESSGGSHCQEDVDVINERTAIIGKKGVCDKRFII